MAIVWAWAKPLTIVQSAIRYSSFITVALPSQGFFLALVVVDKVSSAVVTSLISAMVSSGCRQMDDSESAE